MRLFPDVYVRARAKPPDLALRSVAAYRLVEGRGVLSGYSAARLLGADCAPDPGLRVHRNRPAPGEIVDVGGLRCTSPLRTAYDLARRPNPVGAVVGVDRLANVHRFAPDLLLNFAIRYRGSRGNERVPDVLAAADRYSGSPMESRLRMEIVNGGLPRPRVLLPGAGRGTAHGGLARHGLSGMRDRHRVGDEHTRPERVLRDVGRYTRLVDRGWRIYRYTKRGVPVGPDRGRAHPGSPTTERHRSR
jgi:hypothetical protein